MASRMRLKVALFYMDMDDLKWINDSLGHAAGDQALQGMAAVLKGSFRSSDILARYGGDEFVALVVITADHSTENLLTRIQEQVGLYTQSYSESRLSFSTGIATFTWDQPLSLDGLLAEADRAMYKIKLAKKVS
jgi:diguanylate cyclase (GGDEF)-like protein